MNKTDYVLKMNNILNYHTKFSCIDLDEKKLLLKLEDKINNFLRPLKNAGGMLESLYKSCYASSTRLGSLYGLPKIHKPGLPMRPIVPACNTYNYNLSKVLVPLLYSLHLPIMKTF